MNIPIVDVAVAPLPTASAQAAAGRHAWHPPGWTGFPLTEAR